MRRVLSIWMLLLLGFGQASPAGALAPGMFSGWTAKAEEARLPACCRRGGKHHCALGGGAAAGTGWAESSREVSVGPRDSCPFAPQALASAVPTMTAWIPSPSRDSLLSAALLPLLGLCMVAMLGKRRGPPERGPPTLAFL